MIRLLSILLAVGLLAGCSGTPVETGSYSEPIYSRQYRSGSATVMISLSETNIPTSGNIRMLIDVHAPKNTEVIIPDLGNSVGTFQINDTYTEPLQNLPNGKQLHRRAWILTPGLAGETAFQSLEISVGMATIKTDSISIGVESLLPPGIDRFEIKDIAPPIELLPEQEKERRSAYTVLGALLTIILILVIIFRLRRPKPVVIILPHETAFQALENLPENPVEKIHELNRILRAYYETRFNIPTIGKTLAELLSVLDDDEIVRFLKSCEEFRFANKVPEGFAEEAEQFVRDYIGKTMEVPPCD